MRDSVALLKEPMLLSMGLILAFQSGMEGMSNDWMTRYFSKVTQASDQHALYALTALVAAMTVTRLLLGGLLKKVCAHRVLFSSIAFAASGSLVLMAEPAYPMAVVGVILIGIGLSAGFPVMLGYIGDLYSHRSGTAFSIVFVIALTGNMIINKLMGRIAQEYGIAQYTKVMLGCLALFALLLSLVLKHLNKNNSKSNIQNEQRRKTMA